MPAIKQDDSIRGTYRNSRNVLVATVYRYDTDKGYGFMGHDYSDLCRANSPDVRMLRHNLAIQASKK